MLQVLVVHAPWLHGAFGKVPLSAADWLLCSAIASSVQWTEEIKKVIARRASRPR